MYNYMHEECDDINWQNLNLVNPSKSAKTLLEVVMSKEKVSYNSKND